MCHTFQSKETRTNLIDEMIMEYSVHESNWIMIHTSNSFVSNFFSRPCAVYNKS